MRMLRRDRGVTTVEWVIVAMIIGVGCIAVFRTFKDSYMQPATNRMGDCIEAAAGDGNLCGGLATGGASNGGGGNAAGGNAAAGGNGVGGNGVGGNGVGGNAAGGANAGGALAQNGNGAAGGGMSANELANSVGGAHGTAGAGPAEANHGEGNGHGEENPHAETVNRIAWGMGLEQAGEDALIEAARGASGAEGAVADSTETLFKIARQGEGALIAVPLDVIANGVPHNVNDGASLAAKTAIVGAAGWFGGPVGAVAAVGLDKSIGYVADSITGGNRYQADWEDSIAWRMAHGQAGTIGKEGLEAEQAREQQQVHEQLDYMRQQRERDAEALREMMPH